MICTLHQILSGDSVERNEMSGTCGTYGERRGAYGLARMAE
jgi:hypothetical protein